MSCQYKGTATKPTLILGCGINLIMEFNEQYVMLIKAYFLKTDLNIRLGNKNLTK
jgi:hypothetical protein